MIAKATTMHLRFLSVLAALSLAACGRNHPAFDSSHVMSFAEFTAGAPASATDQTCDVTCQSHRKEFAYIVYVGKQIYCYWDEKKAATGTDFDALAARLTARIATGTSLNSYFAIVREWASSFHDGHVNLLTGDDLSSLELYSAPVRFELLAPGTDHESLVVASVADVTGLKVGQVVQRIDGMPVDTVLTAGEAMVSGSTAQMRRRTAARRLSDAVGPGIGSQPLVIAVQHDQGVAEVPVPRLIKLSLPPDTGAPPRPEPTGSDSIKTLILPGNLGYLKIDGFVGSKDAFLFDEAMDRLANTMALIIDVRANGGGDQSGDRILARLSASPLNRYRVSERQADFMLASRPSVFTSPAYLPGQAFSAWHDDQVPRDQRTPHYDHPVAVLTSSDCFSACDTFVAALKANKLATVIGEPTGGGTGTPLVFELPVSTGFRFRYSVVKGRTIHDEPIEGVGTTPDLMVEAKPSDVADHIDAQLTAATAYLLKQGQPVAGLNASAIAASIQSVSIPYTTDLDVSPTVAHERWLNQIAAFDER